MLSRRLLSVILRAILRGGLCLWLALAAPIICQYHGLIWSVPTEVQAVTAAAPDRFDPHAHHAHHHHAAHAPATAAIPLSADVVTGTEDDAECATLQCVLPMTHHGGGDLLLMTLFVAAMPPAPMRPAPPVMTRADLSRFVYPSQHSPSPPDTPPEGTL